MTQEEMHINNKPKNPAKDIKREAKNASLEDIKKGCR